MSMTVEHLERHLDSLAEIMRLADGKKVADDLAAIQRGLVPFRQHSLKDFADFLVRAEAYRAGGEVPIPAKGSRRGASSPRPRAGAAKPDPVALANETRELYDRAATPEVTVEKVNELIDRLNKLKVAELVDVVGQRLEMNGLKSKKTKPKTLEAIKAFILDRKGGSQRATWGEQPSVPMNEPPVPSGSRPLLGSVP